MLDHMSSTGVMHGDGRRRGEERVIHEEKKENIAAVHARYRNSYDRVSWTIIFLSIYSALPLSLYYGHPPFAPCYSLELDLLSDTETGARCLADCAPPPLSITCLTLALTVPSTHASVPADVHPLCPSYALFSSLLPYVSSHRWCALSNPLTCVIPRPLYAF